MPFILDTNIFITAHRAHYPIDLMPAFWDKIKDQAIKGNLISIDSVEDEINQNDDELTKWCSANLPSNFFRTTEDEIVIDAYSNVVNWATNSTHFNIGAIDEFLLASNADAWLISYALAYTLPLVTYETSNPERKKSIKIPEPCNHFHVDFLTPIELLRNLQVII